jgi:hypothetical protein
MDLNAPCILCRCIEKRWYVIRGHQSDEYDQAFYLANGVDFDNWDAAIDHARSIAKSLGISELDILEDYGAGDWKGGSDMRARPWLTGIITLIFVAATAVAVIRSGILGTAQQGAEEETMPPTE